MADAKDNKFFRFGLYALFFLLVLNLVNTFTDKDPVPTSELQPIVIESAKNSYSLGSAFVLEVTNNTEQNLRLDYDCPNAPFTVLYTSVTPAKEVKNDAALDCEYEDKLLSSFSVPAGATRQLTYDYWSNSLFSELGRYKVTGTFTIDGETFQTSTQEIEYKNRGLFRKIWFFGLYQPFYNAMVFLISVLPGYSLALGIVAVTLIVRLILLFPSQKAMRSQKQLQEIQPKLEELKKKYKNDQQRLAQETMKIWKEHKVNPLGNCLPLLVQFPLLLALFHVVSDGISVSTANVLYSPLSGFDYSLVNDVLFGILPLTEKNIYVLPLVIGGLQFIQMKLSFGSKKAPKADKSKSGPDMQSTQKIMMYFLPAMIAVFTASLPAGVGLYWGTSTLFAIIQQLFINKDSGKSPNGSKVIEAETV